MTIADLPASAARKQPTRRLGVVERHAAVRERALVGTLYLAYTASRLLASNDRTAAIRRAGRLSAVEHRLRLNEHGAP